MGQERINLNISSNLRNFQGAAGFAEPLAAANHATQRCISGRSCDSGIGARRPHRRRARLRRGEGPGEAAPRRRRGGSPRHGVDGRGSSPLLEDLVRASKPPILSTAWEEAWGRLFSRAIEIILSSKRRSRILISRLSGPRRSAPPRKKSAFSASTPARPRRSSRSIGGSSSQPPKRCTCPPIIPTASRTGRRR